MCRRIIRHRAERNNRVDLSVKSIQKQKDIALKNVIC